MNPMAVAALTAILRHLLSLASGFLVAWGIWEEKAAAMYVGAAASALVAFGWSYLEKRWARRKLMVAASMTQPATERQIEAVVRAGDAPSTTTPKNVVPVPTV